MQNLVLLRHGESNKNLKDKHGGPGEPLTEKGKQEIINASKMINEIKALKSAIIYYSERQQLIETVNFLCPLINGIAKADNRILPLGLGILDGLSNEEAMRKFPYTAKLMNEWREGKIEICDLIIPKAESLQNFWNRGKNFLSEIIAEESFPIIVGTRSILTLLISILLKRGIMRGGGYKSITIPPGGMLTFSKKGSNFSLLDEYCNYKIDGV